MQANQFNGLMALCHAVGDFTVPHSKMYRL